MIMHLDRFCCQIIYLTFHKIGSLLRAQEPKEISKNNPTNGPKMEGSRVDNHGEVENQFLYQLSFFFRFFKTEFLCVALAILELTL